jgi:dihydroorotase
MHINIHLLYPVDLTQSRDNGVRSASDTGDSLKTVSTYTMQLCVRVTERKRNKKFHQVGRQR